MNIFEAVYKAKFSVLSHATYTYLTAVIAIAQILIIEVAETTAQTGYDRADWFYGVWATAHYSEMPETQPVNELDPDYWFEPNESVLAIANELPPLHRFIPVPTAFVPFGLLAPVPQVATASTKRSQKPTQAPKSLKGRAAARKVSEGSFQGRCLGEASPRTLPPRHTSLGIAPRKAPTMVRSSTGALIPID